ncbi:hypothetical protein GCM10010371_69240 [Streptomyces subrutilus]|uniref:Uncharacterized protein n=1 Tax=Streptomyces subrutilus TaxID=36818 RepID=A0A918RJY8_9ACTN|nr:hypothetical protein GCM10010371_69240 [Streptomyces subrutilus]
MPPSNPAATAADAHMATVADSLTGAVVSSPTRRPAQNAADTDATAPPTPSAHIRQRARMTASRPRWRAAYAIAALIRAPHRGHFLNMFNTGGYGDPDRRARHEVGRILEESS